MVVGAVVGGEVGVAGGVENGVGRVEDAGGAAGVLLAAEFVADGIRDESVAAADDFLEEGGADGVDVVGGEDTAGEQVDLIGATAFLVGDGGAAVVEMLPEVGGIDSSVLDLGESEVLGVDVMDGEERRDAVAAGDRGDEAGHPVVAVDEVGADLGDGVVDDLALEGEGDQVVFRAVDAGAVVEDAVFSEVDALLGQGAADFLELVVEDAGDVEVEHPAVVWQRDVDIGALVVEGLDQRGGDIGEATGLGAHPLGEVAHAFREVGNFRGDDEDAGAAGSGVGHGFPGLGGRLTSGGGAGQEMPSLKWGAEEVWRTGGVGDIFWWARRGKWQSMRRGLEFDGLLERLPV